MKKGINYYTERYPNDYLVENNKLKCIWCNEIVFLKNALGHLADVEHIKCKTEGISLMVVFLSTLYK